MGLNDWLIKVFGESKVKWIKGVLAGAIILAIGYWSTPFKTFINSVGIPYADVVVAIEQTFNLSMIVLIAFVVFFLGKPIFIATPEEVDDSVPESEPEPEPEIEIDKPEEVL